MYRQIEKIKSDIANLQAETRALNARIDGLVRELTGKTIENKEQSNEKGNQNDTERTEEV